MNVMEHINSNTPWMVVEMFEKPKLQFPVKHFDFMNKCSLNEYDSFKNVF